MNLLRKQPCLLRTILLGSVAAGAMCTGAAARSIPAPSLPAPSLPAHVAQGIAMIGTPLGRETAATPLSLTVWLNLHDRQALDARVAALTDPASPSYHQWLKPSDLAAYLPTASEVSAVRREIETHNLKVVSIDPYNLSIRIQGATSDVETAFGTQINRYSVRGKMVHVSLRAPQLTGAASAAFRGLGGLDSVQASPLYMRPVNLATGKPFPAVRASSAAAQQASASCISAPTSVTVSGVNAVDDKTPATETISGLGYGAGETAAAPYPCGYTPAQVQGLYGLNSAYRLGYTGAGQTIVIIDAGLQPQAQTDANVFSAMYGLPALNGSNYALYAPGGGVFTGAQYGTDIETDLDVEWAHAIAPGAKIALIQSYSGDDEDFQSSLLYAVTNHLGNVISLSYGNPETELSPLSLDVYNSIAELAAAQGISLQVSTGDSGDFTADGVPADVNGLASSPFDTAVGGTSIVTSPTDGSVITAGWGNNINGLAEPAANGSPGLIVDPPSTGSFYAGSGGGASRFFAKPAYQSGLSGTQRLLPDVSALADPFTGALTVYDVQGTTYLTPIGGTSLASPVFSAMWAIFNQFSGHPLGQAAPFVATASPSVIRDVLPVAGPDQVTATITDPSGTTTYSAISLAGPLGSTTEFASVLLNDGGIYYDLTFGTDSSLTVTPGWDNVTGYGTPDVAGAVALFGTTAAR